MEDCSFEAGRLYGRPVSRLWGVEGRAGVDQVDLGDPGWVPGSPQSSHYFPTFN